MFYLALVTWWLVSRLSWFIATQSSYIPSGQLGNRTNLGKMSPFSGVGSFSEVWLIKWVFLKLSQLSILHLFVSLLSIIPLAPCPHRTIQSVLTIVNRFNYQSILQVRLQRVSLLRPVHCTLAHRSTSLHLHLLQDQVQASKPAQFEQLQVHWWAPCAVVTFLVWSHLLLRLYLSH